MFLAEGKKLKKGSNSMCTGSVCMCMRWLGKEAARPMALPVFQWTVPSNTNDLFGRSVLRFIILSLRKWLICCRGRGRNTLGR